MDSSRSLIVVSVGAIVVLAVLMALLPILLQGSNSSTVRTFTRRAVTDELYEDLEKEEAQRGAPRPAPVARAKIPPSLTEAWLPQTRVEKRWAANQRYWEEREAERYRDQSKFQDFRHFMSTSEGGDVQAAFELLRRGKPKDAAPLLERALPAISQQRLEIQQPLLTKAIQLFKAAGEMGLMSKSLLQYLRNLEATIEAGGQKGRLKEFESRMLDDIRIAINEVTNRRGSSQ